MGTDAIASASRRPWWKRALLVLLRAGPPVPWIVRPFIRGAYRAAVAVHEGWPLLLKWIWIEPVMRSVCTQLGRGFRAERLPYMRGRGRLQIGDDVRLSGRSCFYFMRRPDSLPEIRIGNGVFIGNGCTFAAAERILIGDHCLIAPGVRIHDNDGTRSAPRSAWPAPRWGRRTSGR